MFRPAPEVQHRPKISTCDDFEATVAVEVTRFDYAIVPSRVLSQEARSSRVTKQRLAVNSDVLEEPYDGTAVAHQDIEVAIEDAEA